MLCREVSRSRIDESLILLEKAWKDGQNSINILDSLSPVSLFTFSHRFPTIHVPKEHEYLYGFLKNVPEKHQIDFLSRFVEYLAWSPKYIIDAASAVSSRVDLEGQDIKKYCLSALDEHKGLATLNYTLEMAEREGLEEVLRMILQVGCNDVSQAIGHYFSCTESVVKLALSAGMPVAKKHLFALIMYLMQSTPIVISTYEKPTQALNEILRKLARKGGFVSYHYIILVNGLINNREFLGEKHFLHALRGLEVVLPRLNDTLTPEKLDSLINKGKKSREPIKDLETSILKGEKAEAFTLLRQVLNEEGVTSELTSTIAHSYTRIDDHPHDPHYVTFPVSAFELTRHLKDKEVELMLAHTVEFAIERIREYGVFNT